MKAKRVMVTVLAAAALVTASVFGTMAYLTDSEAVTNTFTVGKVGITLDETKVTEYGVKDGDTRVQENTYKLIPGQKYEKDPIVHVDADSEESWLFVKVENEIADIEIKDEAKTVAGQMKANGWELMDKVNNVYSYNKTVKGGDDILVFSSFTIDGDNVDNVTLNGDKTDADNTNDNGYLGKNIIVTAYAVQYAGFEEGASHAWKTTFGK